MLPNFSKLPLQERLDICEELISSNDFGDIAGKHQDASWVGLSMLSSLLSTPKNYWTREIGVNELSPYQRYKLCYNILHGRDYSMAENRPIKKNELDRLVRVLTAEEVSDEYDNT